MLAADMALSPQLGMRIGTRGHLTGEMIALSTVVSDTAI